MMPTEEQDVVGASRMSDDDLLALLRSEEQDAESSDAADDRARALDYYHARPYGDEVEGRSQVVTTEVRDTVEWALPALLEIFTASERAVQFEPQTAQDDAAADQATDACNYVFYRQNNGFLVLYSMFKDALLLGTGAVKWWWAEKTTYDLERYRGLTDDQLAMVASVPGAQVVAHDAKPDPAGGTLHGVEVRVPTDASRICVEAIPPEELRVSPRHASLLLDDCPYVAHVSRKSLSDLRAVGLDVSVEDLDDAAPSDSTYSARREYRSLDDDADRMDEASRTGWVREEYVLVDYDGDGIAERRKIIRTSSRILLNEECDSVPIAAITPTIMAHQFQGMSLTQVVMDLQRQSSAIWRQMLDNLYHANNQRVKVLTSPDGRVQANVDDILSSRPGGMVREYTPGAVTPMPTQWVGAQAFPMLEYIDQLRVNRSGVNYLSSGVDADSINKTARGATLAQNMMQERIKLIARAFAETGVKEIFRGILRLLTRHSSKPLMFRLRDKFVQYDPREWRSGYDMVVNVGLGTGNKDQQLMHLASIAQAQMGLMGSPLQGIVTPKNVYNVQAKIAENAGFKNVAEFWTDPEMAPPQGPGPQAMQAIQMLQAQLQDLQRQVADRSIEFQLKSRELDIKAYGEETDRLKAVPPITPEQVQALVLQTLGSVMASPDVLPPQPIPPSQEAMQ